MAVPFAVLTLVRYLKEYHGNVPEALGAVLGAALAALLVSWLISRLFKTRRRLTWVITYAVMTIASSAQSLGALQAAAKADAAATATATARLYTPVIAWPKGWAAIPVPDGPAAHGLQSVGGTTMAAIMKVHGQNVALIIGITFPTVGNKPLEEQIKTLEKGEIASAQQQGFTLKNGNPTPSTWRGNRALQEDSQYGADKGGPLQRLVVTNGAQLTCVITYKAAVSQFQTYMHDFESVKEGFVCP
ncbi:MAG: hypothetical protein ABWX83_06230 [Luteibacter sp.]